MEKRHSTRLRSMIRSNRRARGNEGGNTTYFSYLHRNHRKDGKAICTNSDIDETQDEIESKNPYGGALVREQLERQRRARAAYEQRLNRERQDRERIRERRRHGSWRRHGGGRHKAIPTQEPVYYSSKGDVILDASVFETVDINDMVATCSHCHRTIKLSKIFAHYNKTTHRFFYNVRPIISKK